MERHIDQNRSIIECLDCCHKQIYVSQTNVKISPGHRAILLNIGEYFKEISHSNEPSPTSSTAFSSVMNAMISTGFKNHNKLPNRRRYPKLLTDFAIYTYLSGGKASYKMLCRNLPMPNEGTICKLITRLIN